MSELPPAPHPEWEALIRQKDALRSQIARVLTDLHQMNDSRTVILGQYSAAFGDRLLKLHSLEIETARLKREIELVQAALNRGSDVDYHAIQAGLDAEFEQWQAKLEAEARKLSAQREVLNHLMTPESAAALTGLFRKLVRRLHPDLHPEQPAEHEELWHRVTAAYDAGDLEELEALEILTIEGGETPPPDSFEQLRDSIAKLRGQLDGLLRKLADTRKLWPFDQEPVLNDPAATAAKQQELDERIAAAEALRAERRHWLNLLLDH